MEQVARAANLRNVDGRKPCACFLKRTGLKKIKHVCGGQHDKRERRWEDGRVMRMLGVHVPGELQDEERSSIIIVIPVFWGLAV